MPRHRNANSAAPPRLRLGSEGFLGHVISERDDGAVTVEPFKVAAVAHLFRSETHVVVLCNFIDLIKLPNVETLICLVPPPNHFMF